MNETITYEWSEELGRSAIAAVHAAKRTRLWVMVAVGLFFTAGGLWTYFFQGQVMGLVFVAGGLFWLSLPVWTWFIHRRLVKDVKRLYDDPTITVLIDEDGMTMTSGKNCNRVEWSKISKITDFQGFLILDCGKLTVASLPKRFFSESQIEFVKSRVLRK